MNKKQYVTCMLAGMIAMCGLGACGKANTASTDTATDAAVEKADEQATPESSAKTEVNGAAYGYAGTDPVEAAAYKYMVEEEAKNYDPADVSIPVVQIVKVDYTNPEDVLVYGDFWVYNYNIDGDTLTCVSGGNYPGVMHLAKEGDAYVVSSFDMVADGVDFDASAKELFGDNYEAFMKVYGDSEARDELRKITVSDYVNLNNLAVTQYQDYGWDPVQLNK